MNPLTVIGAAALMFVLGWLLGHATARRVSPPGNYVELTPEEMGTGWEQ